MNSLYSITGSPFRVFPLGNNEKTFDKGVFMKISVNTSSSYYTIFRLRNISKDILKEFF